MPSAMGGCIVHTYHKNDSQERVRTFKFEESTPPTVSLQERKRA